MNERAATESPVAKRLVVALVAGLVWLVVLVFAWALQPLSDSMITGYNERESGGFDAVVVTTECNNLFASEARDSAVALPEFDFGFDFPRPPCEKTQSDARVAFALNIALLLGLLAAWIFAFRGWRADTADTESALPSDASTT